MLNFNTCSLGYRLTPRVLSDKKVFFRKLQMLNTFGEMPIAIHNLTVHFSYYFDGEADRLEFCT